MIECMVILAAALLLDILLGDPVYRLHPVRLMGHLIAWIEKILFRTGNIGLAGGGVLFAGSVVGVLGVFLVLTMLWHVFPIAGILVFVFVLYSCIGFMDMFHHAVPVKWALESGDIDKARALLQRIVGRDTAQLDKEGIARAAVETVAENFVDGFLAVIFWFAIGGFLAYALGLPAAPVATGFALIYRVVNTLDAMVGYRNERYKYFGTISARSDDVLNFIPARLSIPVIAVTAAITGLKAFNCVKIGFRDRLNHVSPNAGHAESCVAGALGIRLGGPVAYPHKKVEKPWMGDAIHDIGPVHIHHACVLIFFAGWIAILPVIFLFSIFV